MRVDDTSEMRAAERTPPESAASRRERQAGLLTSARAGHRDALALLVGEVTPLLWHVARAQGLDHGDAQDAVQTTWLHLLRELDDIREPAALTGWLVTVCRREAIRMRNDRRRAGAEVDPDTVSSTGSAPDESVISDARGRALWAAVAALPDRCQELIRVVAFVDRPDYAVVSSAIGMPRGAIGPTRGRCLAKLRQLLTAVPDWSWP
jgi:RNA polymerase sigma factor (sigma-70 family)